MHRVNDRDTGCVLGLSFIEAVLETMGAYRYGNIE